MSFRYKIDVVEALKNAGYTSYKIRQEGIINQAALQKLRDKKMIAWEQLNTVCNILNCQLGDIIEHVQDCVCDQCQGGTPGGSNAPDPTEMSTPGGSGLVRRGAITPVSPRKK